MLFSELPNRLADIHGRIGLARDRGGHGQRVRIVAVTKTHGPDAVMAAMAAGISDIGENKVQEAMGKQDALAARAAMTGGIPSIAPEAVSGGPAALRWHLIGHLQRNKVKFLDRFSLFHAVDSARLADAIDQLGQNGETPIDVLLEVNVSGEESKGGFGRDDFAREVERLATAAEAANTGDTRPGLRVCGVMTMAPFDADEATLRHVFAGAREARDICRAAGLPADELSMGMSGDYEVAVEEGATMVRLGTILFGERTP